MSLPQQKFREAVFQMLYSIGFGAEAEEMVPFMMGELKTTRKAIFEVRAKVNEISGRLSEIDALIASFSTEYSFERISRVELTLLRLGLFELLFHPSLDPKIAMAEGVRLCRKFGTPESAQFVHAILDGVYKKHASQASTVPQTV